MSLTIILGALRVFWLQGLSTLAAAWLNPVLKPFIKVGLGIAGASAVAIGVYLIWPSGNSIERAVMAALSQRQTITDTNIDEEKRDNAWLEEQARWMQAERDKAAGPVDRVLWHADDPWLRSKREAKGH